MTAGCGWWWMARQNLRVYCPRERHRTWQANRELTVRAGNAGGVYVAVNNANAKQLGQPGKVEEVTYRAN
jgi:hypothetical protein